MKTIKRLSDKELYYGIQRCEARLSGVCPMGYMTREMTEEALSQYRNELRIRKQNEIQFDNGRVDKITQIDS